MTRKKLSGAEWPSLTCKINFASCLTLRLRLALSLQNKKKIWSEYSCLTVNSIFSTLSIHQTRVISLTFSAQKL